MRFKFKTNSGVVDHMKPNKYAYTTTTRTMHIGVQEKLKPEILQAQR